MRDLMNSVHVVNAIAPVAARTDNTAIVSSIIDLKGYGSAMFALSIGTNTDVNATFAVLLEESDDSGFSTSNAVDDAYLNGTEALAGFTFGDDTETRKLGYTGVKRYLRLTVTPSGNDSGNIFLAGVAILGHPDRQPTANPPQ